MIQKKVCMLGKNGAGKSSLVARFVKSIYSEVYYATVGVKVDKKTVRMGDYELQMILWDLAGDDEWSKHRALYMESAAGYLLVIDGTRRASLDKAFEVQSTTEALMGDVPFVCVVK